MSSQLYRTGRNFGMETEMTNEISHSVMSEVNPYQDSPQSDWFTSEDVWAALAKEFSDLIEEVSTCEAEFNHVSKPGNRAKFSYSQESTFNSREVEYREILNLKGNLIEKITAGIENMTSSSDIPKAKVHCYQNYVALLKRRLENSQQEISQLPEDIRKTRQELERLEQQVETFKKLKEDEKRTNEGDELTDLFTQAKEDLNTVLSHLYPENVSREFSNTMAQLTDAFIRSNDEEDQYVELSHEILQNSGILCMIKSFVIIEDPSNPLRYRLNMAE